MKSASLVFFPGEWKARLVRSGKTGSGECQCIAIIPASSPLRPVPIKGLAERFSRLETPEDIDTFAREFGPLGLAWKQPWERPKEQKGETDYQPKYHRTPWPRREKLSHWLYHIATVRRLLRIYYILKRAKRSGEYDAEEALRKVIRINEEYRFSWAKEERTGLYKVVWAEDGVDTGLLVGEDGEEPMTTLDTAALVLTSIISRNLNGGIQLDYDIVPARDTAIGFRVVERKYTQYLLAAIYYDLWEMVTEGRPVITCEFCGKVIEKTGRRRYCNDACKQAAYRERKRQAQ